MSMKKCNICQREKPLDQFNVYRVYKGTPKYRGMCTSCYNKQASERPKTPEEKKRHAEKERKRRRSNPAQMMIDNAKARAKRKGIEFSLTKDDIHIPDRCPILGIPLRRGGNFLGNSPSLDRVDNTKGYTPDNIVVVSLRANKIKNDATLEELKLITEFYSNL